jgi:hypothetical protein
MQNKGLCTRMALLGLLATGISHATCEQDWRDFDKVFGQKLVDAVGHNKAEDVDALLALGADPDLTAQAGHSMLITAAGFENTTIVESLLAYNADVNWQNNYGDTALMVACCLRNPRLVERLMAAGADPDLLNNDCRNAFDCATGLTIEQNACIEFGLDPEERGYMYGVVCRNRPVKEDLELQKEERLKQIKKLKKQARAWRQDPRLKQIKNLLRGKMVLGNKRLVATPPESACPHSLQEEKSCEPNDFLKEPSADNKQSSWGVSPIRLDFAVIGLLGLSLLRAKFNG